MCGIMGMIINRTNGFGANEVDQVVGNLFVNSWRGRDSTGIVQVDVEGNSSALKVLGSPPNLIMREEWKSFSKKMIKNSRLVFGHGRWATSGNVTLQNAHPFHVKNQDGHEMLLVHNGTLDKFQTLPGFHDYDVDSQWLAQTLVNLGPVETLGRIKGAMALVWWNDHSKTLNIYRNDERPLHIVEEKNGNMHLNSVPATLMWMKQTFTLEFDFPDIKQFGKHIWYELPLDDPGAWKEKEVAPPIAIPTFGNDWHAENRRRANAARAMYDDESVNDDLSDDAAAFDNGDAQPDPNFEKDVASVWGGHIKKIQYFKGDMKYVYLKSGTVETEKFTKAPKIIPGLIRMELKGPTDLEVVERDNKSGVCSIEHYTPFQWAKYYKACKDEADGLTRPAVDTRLKPGCIVKFHTDIVYKQKPFTCHHKALCEFSNPQFLRVYQNDIDGTFEIGSRILFEPYDFKNAGKDELRVKGYLWSVDGGAAITCELVTKKFSKAEIVEDAMMSGLISSMFLPNRSQKKDQDVGDVHFSLIDPCLGNHLSATDTEELAAQQKLDFSEALQKCRSGHPTVVTYPANEE